MKGYAMLKIGESGWIEKEKPDFGHWMPFANHWQLPSVHPMFTLSGKAPSENVTI